MERSVLGATPLTKYQFERVGYFCVDYNSTAEKVSGHGVKENWSGKKLEIVCYLQLGWNAHPLGRAWPIMILLHGV